MMPLSRGLSSGRTLARGHREACCGLKIWLFHPHDSTKTPNFNVEAQCTPSRSAIMTGRFSIRSGTHSVPISAGLDGLTRWEVTIAEALSSTGHKPLGRPSQPPDRPLHRCLCLLHALTVSQNIS